MSSLANDHRFYGLGMNNPRTIAKIFASGPVDESIRIPSWNTNPQDPSATIYDTLKTNAERSIYTVCIASVAGSALFIFFANYIRRRNWLIGSFLAQGLVFIITGGTFYAVFHKQAHYESVVLVALCHFLFNFGDIHIQNFFVIGANRSYRSKYFDFHDSWRDLPLHLSLHMPWHRCRFRQARKHSSGASVAKNRRRK